MFSEVGSELNEVWDVLALGDRLLLHSREPGDLLLLDGLSWQRRIIRVILLGISR